MAINDFSQDSLVSLVEETYQGDEANGAALMEQRLTEVLADCSPEKKETVLDSLITEFSRRSEPDTLVSGISPGQFNKLLTMLLGKEILGKNLPPDKMVEQLAAAVNTVFDSVNTLVGGINATLMGSTEGEETIRLVIRSSMDTDEGIGALKKFLDQTGEFFAIALKAYKEAARVKIAEILDELNPEHLEKEFDGKMKFGPLHKANLYDSYVDKYKTLQNWQRSGLLLEAFMKEFEKNCQNLHAQMTVE